MITIKNNKEIELMREAGRICATVLAEMHKYIVPGVTTKQLDEIAERIIRSNGATPSFKGLYGFPASVCISVNEEVVHGIPGAKKLKNGEKFVPASQEEMDAVLKDLEGASFNVSLLNSLLVRTTEASSSFIICLILLSCDLNFMLFYTPVSIELVISSIGMKTASKHTTTIKPIIRIKTGSIAAVSFFIEYST